MASRLATRDQELHTQREKSRGTFLGTSWVGFRIAGAGVQGRTTSRPPLLPGAPRSARASPGLCGIELEDRTAGRAPLVRWRKIQLRLRQRKSSRKEGCRCRVQRPAANNTKGEVRRPMDTCHHRGNDPPKPFLSQSHWLSKRPALHGRLEVLEAAGLGASTLPNPSAWPQTRDLILFGV